jgi:hypothetical protein
LEPRTTLLARGLGNLLRSLGFWRFDTRLPLDMVPGGAPVFMVLSIAKLVRPASRGRIFASFAAGRMRLWQGWPTDRDTRAPLRQVRDRVAGAVARAPFQRIHPTADEHRKRHA